VPKHYAMWMFGGNEGKASLILNHCTWCGRVVSFMTSRTFLNTNLTITDDIYHYTAIGFLIVHRWQQEKGITGSLICIKHTYIHSFIHLLLCVVCVANVLQCK
jgi:hypothetical protein